MTHLLGLEDLSAADLSRLLDATAGFLGVGVGDVPKRDNLKGKVVAGGWDLLPATMKGIRSKDVQYTIGSNPYITAYYALLDLYFYKTKGIPPVSIDTGVTLVDASNVAAYSDVAKKEVNK